MPRWLLIGLILAIGFGAAFLIFRNDGLAEQVTQRRVEGALLDARVPPRLAGCMAEQLTDRLTITQLRSLEKLGPQDGESRLPTSLDAALERLRRIEDREAVKELAGAASACAMGDFLDRVNI